MLKILILTIATVVCVPAVPDVQWKTLLGAPGHFFEIMNSKSSGSSNKETVLAELKEFLEDDVYLQIIYQEFLVEYERNTENTESRRKIFAKNLLEIAEHNLDYKEGENEFFEEISPFTDLDNDELMAEFRNPSQYLAKLPKRFANMTFDEFNLFRVPREVDWRASGAVTGIKRQSNTTACTAFCVTATVESFISITSGKKAVSLSEQHIIDCKPGDLCTEGVNKQETFAHVKSFGLATSAEYPFKGKKGKCRSDVHIAARIKDYKNVGMDEDHLKAAVAKWPVAVSLQTGRNYSAYKGGVFSEDCVRIPNHCVTVVGYTQHQGKPVWIIKNSMGIGWGEKGYMYIRRNGKNNCCIFKGPMTPKS